MVFEQKFLLIYKFGLNAILSQIEISISNLLRTMSLELAYYKLEYFKKYKKSNQVPELNPV